MANAVTLQDWQTICGESNGEVWLQNSEWYVDVSGHNKVIVRYDIMKATNVALHLQTAKVSEKKYWRDTKTLTGADSAILTRDAGLTSEFLENFLRWRVASSNTNWQITFRIQLFLK